MLSVPVDRDRSAVSWPTTGDPCPGGGSCAPTESNRPVTTARPVRNTVPRAHHSWRPVASTCAPPSGTRRLSTFGRERLLRRQPGVDPARPSTEGAATLDTPHDGHELGEDRERDLSS